MDSPNNDELDLRGDVVEALNNAKMATKHKEKVEYLMEAREIVLHRDEKMVLLKVFASDFVDFHNDKKAPVRLFVIKFIEDACKVCKEVIPKVFPALVYLVDDKKNQTKVWVTVMNLYRPALSLLCESEFYEQKPDLAKALAENLSTLKDKAVKVLQDKKNKVMSIIDTVKTIALSYLLPNSNAAELESMEVDRGPREARIDTGPDSFTLSDIPRDHPFLSVIVLEQVGTELVGQMCEQLMDYSKEGDNIKPDSARQSIPLVNAISTLALYRPSVREQALKVMFESAENMRIEGSEEDEANLSQHKLRFIQNLRTNLLDLLKDKWRLVLKDSRASIFEALCCIGGKEQGGKAIALLESRDKRTRAKMEKEEQMQLRKRQKMEEEEEERRRRTQTYAEAMDSAELRKLGYPPQLNTLEWEIIRNIHQYPSNYIAHQVILNMDFLPGPPPPSSVVKPANKAIRTFAQFSAYIDEFETEKKAAEGSKTHKAASEVAKTITPLQTLEPRRMALERMLEQHKLHVPHSSLQLFTDGAPPPSNYEASLPSDVDVLIARVACNFVTRDNVDTDMQNDLRPLLIQFISEDLVTRLGLAMATFYHLYLYSQKTGGDFSQYDDLLLQFMETMMQRQFENDKQQAVQVQLIRDKAISKFFTSAPRLPSDIAIPLLTHFCETKNRKLLGLKTLRAMIHYRPAIREDALRVLMYFAVCPQVWIREDAIRCMANQVYPELMHGDPKNCAVIDQFAYEMLLSTINVVEKRSVPSEEQEVQQQQNDQEKEADVKIGEQLESLKAALLERRGDESILKKFIKLKTLDSDNDNNAEESEGKKQEQPAEDDAMEVDQGKEEKGSNNKEGEEEEEKIDENIEEELQNPMDYGADEGGLVEAEEAELDPQTKLDLTRRLQLYVALSRRNQALLRNYMRAYGSCEHKELHKVLENAIVQLVQVLGKQLGPAEALVLFDEFPERAVPLVIHALKLLVREQISDSKLKRSELLQQARQIQNEEKTYKLFDTDDRFVIPVLGALPRSDIRRYLIGILGMDTEYVKGAIDSILLGARFAQTAGSEEEEEEEDLDNQPFSPSDLLVLLVTMEPTEDVTMKNLVDATDICLERNDVYTKDVLIAAIHELLMEEKIPLLLMRIMLKSMDSQPAIKQFIAEAMSDLVDREIWTLQNDQIWHGFIMCAAKLATPAYPILLRLPVEQLASVLDIAKKLPNNNLVARLIYFAKQNQQNLNLPPPVVDLLNQQKS